MAKKQNTGTRYPDLPGWMQGFDLTEQEWKGVRVYVGVLPVHRLAPNEGQIEGLPANPREWTEDEFSNLRASLVETPELFVLRPCLITPPLRGRGRVRRYRRRPGREYALARIEGQRRGHCPGRDLSTQHDTR